MIRAFASFEWVPRSITHSIAGWRREWGFGGELSDRIQLERVCREPGRALWGLILECLDFHALNFAATAPTSACPHWKSFNKDTFYIHLLEYVGN